MVGQQSPKAGSESCLKLVTRTATSFVIPNALRQLDRLFDPTVYQAAGVEGNLIAQIPFARVYGHPAINALGDTVKNPLMSRFYSETKDDAVVQLLVRKDAWPGLPDLERVSKRKGRAMTDDEAYEYTQRCGKAFRTWVTPRLDQLSKMDNAKAKERISEAMASIRERERKRMGF